MSELVTYELLKEFLEAFNRYVYIPRPTGTLY
jgi:hypothetical protein